MNEKIESARPPATENAPEKLNTSNVSPGPNEINGHDAKKEQQSGSELHDLHELHAAHTPQDPPGAFPIDALPEPMREIVATIAYVRQLPIEIPAVCSLALMSGAIGKGLRVESLPDQTTPANGYYLIAAGSGIGKGVGCDQLSQCLREFKTDRDVRLICEDATNEALGLVLQKNDECLISLSTDARDVIENVCGRYRDKGKTDEGILLKAYSWEACIVDRVTRDEIKLEHPCLVILWLVQPDKLDLMFGKQSLREGGLLPRFHVCRIDCDPQKLDRSRGAIEDRVKKGWRKLVTEVLCRFRMLNTTQFIKCDEEAVSVLDDYRETVRLRQIGPMRDISSFAARWNEQAWRLALVLHVGTHGAMARNFSLSSATAKAAVRIQEWFVQQQIAILEQGKAQTHEAVEAKVLALFSGPVTAITATDVNRKRITRNAEDAHALLNEMAASGKLTVENVPPPKRGGHTTRLYRRAPSCA